MSGNSVRNKRLERPVLGLAEAVEQGVFALSQTFGLAIRASGKGHSFSSVFLVYPSPKGYFGKKELGTDFRKGVHRTALSAIA